jgi:hypothetical protein
VTLDTAETSAAVLIWRADDTSDTPADVSLQYGADFLLGMATYHVRSSLRQRRGVVLLSAHQ